MGKPNDQSMAPAQQMQKHESAPPAFQEESIGNMIQADPLTQGMGGLHKVQSVPPVMVHQPE